MESGVESRCETPFGSEWTTDVLGTDQKLRFTGHERDLMNPSYTTDDLDYMHARHYNLNLGRFLSVDPAPADPMRPQSWNAYAYVLNNPLKFTDPFGLSGSDPNGGTDDCGLGEGCGSLSTWGQWLLNLLLPDTDDDEDDDPYGEAAALENLGLDGSESIVKRAKKADAGLKDAGGMIVEEGVTAVALGVTGRAVRLIHFGEGVKAEAGVFHRAIKPRILKAAGGYRKTVGKNPNIRVVNGVIHLVGQGPFRGATFVTDLKVGRFF